MLPLLETLSTRFEYNHFRGWTIIYVMHLLHSNCSCIDFLCKHGATKSDTFIFGKGYSTSKDVLSYLQSEHFNVVDHDGAFRPNEAHDEFIIEHIERVLLYLAERTIDKLLVIDEGGLATRALARHQGVTFKRLALVELTQRGVQYFENITSRAAVVNVAQSRLKKTNESIVIGRSMVSKLRSHYTALSRSLPLSESKIVIIGNGAIGRSVSHQLQLTQVVTHVVDVDIWLNRAKMVDVFADADVVLASTGMGIQLDLLLCILHRDLPVFYNCGSSDVEFELYKYVQLFVGDDAIDPRIWDRDTLLGVKSTIWRFARGGFPINFDGSADPIRAEDIQLTRAILMAGAAQVVTIREVGVFELGSEIQEVIAQEYALLTDTL